MKHEIHFQDVAEAVKKVRSQDARVPEIVLVLGSGLGHLADTIENPTIIPTHDLPGYPASTVVGHKGQLVIGEFEGRVVMFIQGRVHWYEGHSIKEVAFPVRLSYMLGARRMVVTNAAGGINKDFGPGTLMFISDHINMAFANPLSGPDKNGGPRFPDMSDPYDADWLEEAEAIALKEGVATRKGVYVWVSGPSYETKAEVKMLGILGADAVGMSTVPEVVQAKYAGMKVLGISTITNPAAGLSPEPLDHEDVLEVGKQIKGELEKLVRGIVKNI